MKINFKTISWVIMLPLASLAFVSCASISENECATGSWQDIGYKDGRNGKSRGRFADISKTCGKYNIVPDRAAYMNGYDQGLPLYCTYDKGFSRGEDGSSLNQECAVAGFTDYVEGHADGRVVYEIKSEHRELIENYEETEEALIEVRRRLDDPEIAADEKKRLRKKAYRLETRAEDIRIDIRAMERLYPDLPRYNFY